MNRTNVVELLVEMRAVRAKGRRGKLSPDQIDYFLERLGEVANANRCPWDPPDLPVIDVPTREPRDAPGVYVIHAVGRDVVKIGASNTVRSRIRRLQCASVEDFQFIGLLSLDPNHERIWHDRFSRLHVRREWFNLTSSIVASVAAFELGLDADVYRAPIPPLEPRIEDPELESIRADATRDAMRFRARLAERKAKALLRSKDGQSDSR